MEISVNCMAILFLTCIFVTVTSVVNAETRYVCVRRILMGVGIDDDGMENELEMDEGFEADDMYEADEVGGGPMMGTLDCTNKTASVIIVTKLIYGVGGLAGCSSPQETCDQEAFSDQEISPQCDGKPTCVIRAMPRVLPKCPGRPSDFIHVEYECIKPNSLFNICKETRVTIKTPHFLIQSPGKADYPKGGYAMCECIMLSRLSNDILMEYTHINMLDPQTPPGASSKGNAGNAGNCKGNYILLESRRKPNQTNIDKRLKLCGRKTVSNKIFKGALRLTFASKSMFSDEGFLTKFQVKTVGGASLVNMQCGAVDLPPNSPLLKNNQPTGMRTRNPGPFAPPFLPGPIPPAAVPPQYWQWQGQPPNPFVPGQFNGPPFPGRGTLRGGSGRSNSGNGEQQVPTFNQNPSRKWNTNVRPGKASASALPPSLEFIGSKSPSVNSHRAHQTEVEVAKEKDKSSSSSSGQIVGYIVGGIGAALTAICAIVVVLVYSRRKKRYERHRDIHPMASFRNSGRRVQVELDPVYTSPAEVDDRRHRVSTKHHSNSAYVSDLPERIHAKSDGHYEGNDMDSEGYSTVGLASRENVEEIEVVNARASDSRAMAGHDYDNNFRRGRR